MKVLKIIGIIISILVIIFLLQYLLIGNMSFFNPKIENTKREVYENTQSYVEGKRQAITKYYQEWKFSKSDNDKETIKQVVLQEFANFDLDKLSPTQRDWYNEIIQ